MRKYIVTVNGNRYEVEVEEIGGVQGMPQRVEEVRTVQPVIEKPQEVKREALREAVATTPGSSKEVIKSPMPGTILSVNISEGMNVKKGDVLFILEAMKMENEIMASVDGVVGKVAITKGTSVNTDDLLAIIE